MLFGWKGEKIVEKKAEIYGKGGRKYHQKLRKLI